MNDLPELTTEEREAAIHEGRVKKFFRLKAEKRGNNELKAGINPKMVKHIFPNNPYRQL